MCPVHSSGAQGTQTVRSIEGRGYTFLGGGHPALPPLAYAVDDDRAVPPSVRYRRLSSLLSRDFRYFPGVVGQRDNFASCANFSRKPPSLSRAQDLRKRLFVSARYGVSGNKFISDIGRALSTRAR